MCFIPYIHVHLGQTSVYGNILDTIPRTFSSHERHCGLQVANSSDFHVSCIHFWCVLFFFFSLLIVCRMLVLLQTTPLFLASPCLLCQTTTALHIDGFSCILLRIIVSLGIRVKKQENVITEKIWMCTLGS